MQGSQRNALQSRDDIRSIRYHDIGSRLRDMTVCDRLSKCVIRRAHKRHEIALTARSMGLETLDQIVSIAAEVEHERVVAGVALKGEIYCPSGQCGRIDGVVAGAAFDHQMITKITALRMVDGNLIRQSTDRDQSPGRRDVDLVVAAGAVDRHSVGRAVARAAAEGSRQIDGDLLDAGAGKVVDNNVVGAAKGLELNALDAIEVHRDIGDVAEERRVGAIGRDGDIFDDVGTAKVERIEAAPAIDDIAAVAWIPDEDIIAGAEKRKVGALSARDDIITGAADQQVGALAADNGIVAGAAIDRELSQPSWERRSIDRIVPADAIDHDVIDTADVCQNAASIAGQHHVLAICGNFDDLVGTGAVKNEFAHAFILDEFGGAQM